MRNHYCHFFLYFKTQLRILSFVSDSRTNKICQNSERGYFWKNKKAKKLYIYWLSLYSVQCTSIWPLVRPKEKMSGFLILEIQQWYQKNPQNLEFYHYKEKKCGWKSNIQMLRSLLDECSWGQSALKANILLVFVNLLLALFSPLFSSIMFHSLLNMFIQLRPL